MLPWNIGGSLVLKLSSLPESEYHPVPERTSNIKHGDGIWDRLGYYSEGIVSICDKNICDFLDKQKVSELPEKIGVGMLSSEAKRNCLFSLLREITRLHEHAHAYLHLAKIGGVIPERWEGYYPIHRGWFFDLPKEVNEPLAEFIVRSIVESSEFKQPYVVIFDELDKPHNTPEYYRKWRDIVILVGAVEEAIPPIVKFARGKRWSSWSDFCTELFKNREEIKNEILALSIPRLSRLGARTFIYSERS